MIIRNNGEKDVVPMRRLRPVSERMLENVALYYLQRFAASTESLRRVLLRRVERSARVHDTDRSEGRALVEIIVSRLAASGLVDDGAFAVARAARLHRQGKPACAIAAHLRERGIAPETIEATLSGLARDEGGDWRAAVNFARRRRLGPFRTGDRAAHRDKDLAAFARAGFSYAAARRVLAAQGPENLEAGEEG